MQKEKEKMFKKPCEKLRLGGRYGAYETAAAADRTIMSRVSAS